MSDPAGEPGRLVAVARHRASGDPRAEPSGGPFGQCPRRAAEYQLLDGWQAARVSTQADAGLGGSVVVGGLLSGALFCH